MVKLKPIINGMLQDYLLYEGLIHTTDIDSTVDHLEMWCMDNLKFTQISSKNNKIKLKYLS